MPVEALTFGKRTATADLAMLAFDEFAALPHTVTLFGMSGVGKTVLSTSLRQSSDWFHYSADYRIGTRYLVEHILDNVKFKIMKMDDPFVANLLRSDSIYINHNISVDNLDPVSTYLGMYGDAREGGLDKAAFLERQDLYRRAEIESMKDVEHFIGKSWRIYQCRDFVNDTSGSLCEIVDLEDENDPVIAALRRQTIIVYLKAGETYEEQLKKRARTHPKPLFYNPAFITAYLEEAPDDGAGIDPLDFARTLFPRLLEFRRPRYQVLADKFGFTIDAAGIFDESTDDPSVPDAERFLRVLHDAIVDQSGASEVKAANVELYLQACEERRRQRR
jgi:hypothetical protein